MLRSGRQPIFYGWFVVAGCFVASAAFGESFYAFGVFFKPLENEFGWSRSLVSSGSTAFLLGYAVSVLLSGRLADRYKPRFILLASACLAGLGTSLASQISSVAQLRLFLFIAGLGCGATMSVPISTVQRWFYNRRSAGIALAVVASGSGVGQLVFTPLINHFVLNYGWRNAYLITGILTFALIFISSLVIRQSPAAEASQENRKQGSTGGWTTARALTTSAYAGIIYVACVGFSAFQVVLAHIVPYAIDLGMSATAGATILALMGGLSIPSRLASGFISRRIGWQKTLALAMFGMAACLIWLSFLNTLWMLYAFAFFFGTVSALRFVAQLGVLGDFFGLRSLGEIIGLTSALSNLFASWAPYAGGFIFDATGSYFTAFAIMGALAFSGGLVTVLVKKPLLTSG